MASSWFYSNPEREYCELTNFLLYSRHLHIRDVRVKKFLTLLQPCLSVCHLLTFLFFRLYLLTMIFNKKEGVYVC